MGTKCLNSLSHSDSSLHKKRLQQDNLLIEPTGVDKLDDILGPAKRGLDRLIKERKKFKGAYRRFLKTTYTHILSEVTLRDGMIAMLYIYSAGCEGELSKLDLKIVEDSPYILVDCSVLNTHQKAVYDDWNLFLAEMDEIMPLMEKIQGELYQISLTSLPLMMRKSVKSFSEMEQAKISMTLSSNMKKVNSASTVIEELIEFQNYLEKQLQDFVRNCDSFVMQQVSEIGRLAFRANVFEPKKIIMTYWPQEERL